MNTANQPTGSAPESHIDKTVTELHEAEVECEKISTKIRRDIESKASLTADLAAAMERPGDPRAIGGEMATIENAIKVLNRRIADGEAELAGKLAAARKGALNLRSNCLAALDKRIREIHSIRTAALHAFVSQWAPGKDYSETLSMLASDSRSYVPFNTLANQLEGGLPNAEPAYHDGHVRAMVELAREVSDLLKRIVPEQPGEWSITVGADAPKGTKFEDPNAPRKVSVQFETLHSSADPARARRPGPSPELPMAS